MTLKEALEIVKNSVAPGAVSNNGSYVGYDEEADKWIYVDDIDNPKSLVIYLNESQLNHAVIYATSKVWTPVSNFQF